MVQRTGQFAQALVYVLVERGGLTVSRAKRESALSRRSWKAARFSNLLSDTSIADTYNVLHEYGWDEPRPLVEALAQEIYSEFRAPWDDDLNPMLEDAFSEDVGEVLRRCIHGSSRSRDSYLDEDKARKARWKIPLMFQWACAIAAHAVLTSTARWGSRTRNVADIANLASSDVPMRVILGLVHQDLQVREFLDLAFDQLLAATNSNNQNNLIAGTDGQVVSLSTLWSPSTQQNSVLAIRVQPGLIRMDGSLYNMVREIYVPARLDQTAHRALPTDHALEELAYATDSPYRPSPQYSYTCESSAAIRRDAIEVRQYMVYAHELTGKSMRWPVSWLRAIEALVTASHQDNKSTVDVRSMQYLVAERLQQADVFWVEPFSRFDNSSSGAIMKTGNDTTLKFFAAGDCRNFGAIKLPIVIRHGSSLLQCIYQACEMNSTLR